MSISLSTVVRSRIEAAFNAAASEGMVAPDAVENVAARLLPKGALTDAVLDLIIDLTDDKDSVDLNDFQSIMAAVLALTNTWGDLKTSTSGRVGFESLMDQMARKAQKRGFEFNIMVVGESGVGKTTMVDTLFRGAISRRSAEARRESASAAGAAAASSASGSTTKVSTVTHLIEEGGVKMKLAITDTPGFGDLIDNSKGHQPAVAYIKAQYDAYIAAELSCTRRPGTIPDTRVHAVLYFIAPTGHGLKSIDIKFMSAIQELANLIPVIGRADAFTLEERAEFKTQIQADLKANGIKTFPWSLADDDEEELAAKKAMEALLPFAVVGATDEVTVGGKWMRGRQTKWGFIDVDNPEHTEFPLLRDVLVRTHTLDLKEATDSVHYEIYREKHVAITAQGDPNA